MEVLGTELRSSWIALSVFNGWAISPAPGIHEFCFLFVCFLNKKKRAIGPSRLFSFRHVIDYWTPNNFTALYSGDKNLPSQGLFGVMWYETQLVRLFEDYYTQGVWVYQEPCTTRFQLWFSLKETLIPGSITIVGLAWVLFHPGEGGTGGLWRMLSPDVGKEGASPSKEWAML